MGFVFLSIILVLPLSYGLASWIVSTALTKTNIVGGDLSNADRISTPISFRERQDDMPHMRTNDMYEPFCLKALKVLQNSPAGKVGRTHHRHYRTRAQTREDAYRCKSTFQGSVSPLLEGRDRRRRRGSDALRIKNGEQPTP